MTEVHLIIIWSKGLYQQDKIIKDVKTKFTLLQEYAVTWTKDKFPENLSRFYGENLPKNSRKQLHCGADTFLCLVVKDHSPKYDIRTTSKGNKVVNINLFDSKQEYRSWTGGGHKIHATDNVSETMYQLTLLTNKQYSDYLNTESKSCERISLKSDLVGAGGWASISDVFSVLNQVSNYIVLRNYDNLEEEVNSLHPDIDVLCDDKNLFVRLINGKPTTSNKYRVQYAVLINGKKIFFDVRHVGDDYYCSKWQRNMLKNRVLYGNLFILDAEDHYFSLVYHALLHKPELSKDYFMRLNVLGGIAEGQLDSGEFLELNLIDRLTLFMDSKNYNYTVPIDRTVFWNYKLLLKVGAPCLNLHRKFIYEKYKVKLIVKKILRKLRCYE